MKRFLKHITILSLSTWLLAFTLQWIADKGLKSLPNSKFEDWNRLFEGKISTDMVIMGSSKACVNYNPKIIENQTGLSTFNLGFNASSYNLQKIKFKWYLENNTSPKYVIQNIDISHFQPSTQLSDSRQFIPFAQTNILEDLKYDFQMGIIEDNRLPLVKYNSNLQFFIKGILSFIHIKSGIYYSENGFTPVDKNYSPDIYNLNRLKLNDTSLIKQRDYDKVINEVQIASVNSLVLLVYAPVYEHRRSIIKKEMDALREKLYRLDKENDRIYFLDYSDDSLSLSSKYFYDSFHMNRLGAEKFSMKLGKDIKTLIR